MIQGASSSTDWMTKDKFGEKAFCCQHIHAIVASDSPKRANAWHTTVEGYIKLGLILPASCAICRVVQPLVSYNEVELNATD